MYPDKDHASFGEVFGEADMVFLVAAYPYPCGNGVTVREIIYCHIKSNKRTVCTLDDLTILSDATDSVNV